MEACARVVWVFNKMDSGVDHTADRDIQKLTTTPHPQPSRPACNFSAFPQITAVPTMIRARNLLCRRNNA